MQAGDGGDEAAAVESFLPSVRSFRQKIGFGVPSFPIVICNQSCPAQTLLLFRFGIQKSETYEWIRVAESIEGLVRTERAYTSGRIGWFAVA